MSGPRTLTGYARAAVDLRLQARGRGALLLGETVSILAR